MRWFKHISNSHNDEILSELMDEFGAEGYGVWWLILEKIAQLMDESDRTSARFSVKLWASFAKVSAKKLQNIVNFLEKKQRFLINREGNYLTIDCPKLLKYRDEWTERLSKRAKKTHEKLPSNSRGTPVQESQSESDTDIEDDDDSQPENKFSVDGYKALLTDRGFYLNHLNNGGTLEMFEAWIAAKVTLTEAKQAMDRADAQLGAIPNAPSYYRKIPFQIRKEFKQAKNKAEENKNDSKAHQPNNRFTKAKSKTEMFYDNTLPGFKDYIDEG